MLPASPCFRVLNVSFDTGVCWHCLNGVLFLAADHYHLYTFRCRAAKVRFDEDEEFKTRAREAVTRLQSGDTECITAWQRICEASRKEFQAIYDRLGVKLIERGESFYNPMLTGARWRRHENGWDRGQGGSGVDELGFIGVQANA
jgi:hypothetical protein